MSKYITPGTAPMITFHGVADRIVPSEMSVSMHKALDEAGVKNSLQLLPDGEHVFDVGEYSVGGQAVWYSFERFLAARMPVPRTPK